MPDFTPVTAPTERGVFPTPDLATSIGHVGSDMETPTTWYEEGLGFENTVLSDIPEFDNFAGDLSFLDQDDDTPIEPPSQFLQGQSPVTSISEETGDLSLNTISRWQKQENMCSNVFRDSGVGLVSVNQNEPHQCREGNSYAFWIIGASIWRLS